MKKRGWTRDYHDTIDSPFSSIEFTNSLKHAKENGYILLQDHKKKRNKSSSLYPRITPESREKNRLCKLYRRHIDHCMSCTFHYAITLTVPVSSDLRLDGTKLLHIAEAFMKNGADQQYMLQLEVYYNRKTKKKEYHIHGMSTQPINLLSWSKITGAKRRNLYCKPLINQLAWAKYINKDLRLLPRNLHSMKSNIKREKFHAYYGDRNTVIASNDPDIAETCARLSKISSSDAYVETGNIIASLKCLDNSSAEEPCADIIQKSKYHLSSSIKEYNCLFSCFGVRYI